MIGVFALLLACQLAGEVIARGLHLPLPGPVVGLVLLAVLLLVALQRGITAEGTTLARTATVLVSGLGLLFVPTGVGVVQQLGLLGAHAVGIVATIVLSALLTMLATVGAFIFVKRLAGRG